MSLGAASGLAAADPQRTLTVFAAASLSEALPAAAPRFEAEHPGVHVVFSFAGSQQLRGQLAEGAQADVFASANPEEMEAAVAASLVVEGSQRVLAGNRLIVILPADNPAGLRTLMDLARPGLMLSIADEAVPAGRYTRRMLENLGRDPAFGDSFTQRVEQNVVTLEQNVTAVVNKVALGEVDAGIAYASDAAGRGARQVATLEIPEEQNEAATYLIAPLAEAGQPELAAAYVDFLLSEPGQAALRDHGFMPVPASSRSVD